ncbi:MAG TPA: hypothetical protein DEO32_04735 [Ruminococcaceae bacterium]|nr:hypothetical protein [Oscillospiraceae bacterium]
MINFSIFVFIIFAVYESAANIVFGSGRKKYRARRRRRAYAAAAKRSRQQVVLYKPQPRKSTKKARKHKAPRSLLYLKCNCGNRRANPSSSRVCDFYSSKATIA